MVNTRRKGYKTTNRFINFAKEKWWRGDVKYVTLSGGLKGVKGDVLLFENDKCYHGEAKKGKQVTIKKLLDWLEKDNADFLVLEPHGTTQQYIFMPTETWGEMVEEY